MGLADCPQCEKFRQAGLERCPKCGRTFGAAEPAVLALRGTASGQTWELRGGRLVVGRKDALAQVSLEPGDTPLLLDDRLVSRRHAVILAEAGAFWVTDAESRDGTHVNEQEITETTAIQEGDRLRFGDTVLVASIHQATKPVAAPAVDSERTIFQSPAPVKPAARPASERTTSSPTPTVRASEPTTPTPQRITPTPERTTPPASERTTSSSMPTPRASEPTTPAPQRITPTPEPTRPTPRPPIPAPMPTAIPPRQVEEELSIVLDLFERNGGRPALQTLLAHARRAEATPERADALQTLIAWLPTACRMLETELMLIDLLSTRASDAPR